MIKKQVKRNMSLLVAAVMLCCVFGCSSKSNLQIVEEESGKPVYLSFFSSKSMTHDAMAKYWIDSFTERYNRQVYISFDSATYYGDEGLSYRELLEKRLNSSSPDDIYIINAEDVLEFEKKGYWMDLTGMDFVENLSEAALYQSSYNGKIFSLPMVFTGFGFVWNVDLLAEHGLSIPGNEAEFLVVCEKLKDEGVLPYGANKGYALTVPAMCVGLSELYESDNQQMMISQLNSGKIPISRYVRKGLEFISVMIENGYLDPQQALESTPREEDVDLFLAGKCAFICASIGDVSTYNDKEFEVAVTGLPVLPKGCVAVYGADNRLCVNPNSKNLEEALQFIEMVGTQEALIQSATIKNALSSAKNSDIDYPGMRDLVELLQQPGQVPNQDFSLHFNTWESIRDTARELCGGASVQEACDMLDEKQMTDIEKYGER